MSAVKMDFRKILNRLILFIGVGVIAHIIFVLSTTGKESLKHLNELSILHIVVICILMVCPWLGYAARVVMWATFLNEKISYFDAVRIVITADVASALSPTAVGGAPVKAGLLLNRGFSNGNVGFMLTYGVIEDIVFYVTGIVLAAFFSVGLLTDVGSGALNFYNKNTFIIIFSLVFITAYLILLISGSMPKFLKISTYLPIKVKSALYSFKEKFSLGIKDMKSNFSFAFSHGKTRMCISIVVLFMQWMAKFSVLLVIIHAFKLDFETVQIYIRQWVVYVTMLFIPTPGASGGAEASFLLIFGNSIPSDITYLIVSLWRLFTYYFILLSAVILFSTLTFYLKRKENSTIKKMGIKKD
ncbi:MAG: flippase-like domain-containing protein [Saprospiraceae bacterium]|nr:flippase-like domain-containing protein [Saprospiraceae bacterium]